MPTTVLFGTEAVAKNRHLFPGLGSRALIVTGRHSSKLNHSLADLTSALEAEGVEYQIFDQVEPNPSLETIQLGAEMARNFGAEMVIGLGGGSPLDAAKAVAVLTHNKLEGEDIFSGKYSETILPNIAIPTTAGTGSEVTPYAIITDHQKKRKRNLNCPETFPNYALMDPRYTSSLDKQGTINTGIDALSHLLEAYLSTRSTPFSDAIAERGIGILGEVLPHLGGVLKYENREKLLYASMLGGVVIAQCGTTAMHAMGYALTTYKGMDHGRANGLLMAEYLSFVASEQGEKVDRIYDLLDCGGSDKFRRHLQVLFGKPEEITSEEIEFFADKAIDEGNIKSTLPEPVLKDLITIYGKSLSPITPNAALC